MCYVRYSNDHIIMDENELLEEVYQVAIIWFKDIYSYYWCI